MRVDALPIAGAWRIVPQVHLDTRGSFTESYRVDHLEEVTGRRLDLAQVNVTVSHRGVVRGIHFTDVPPGQAKYVTCVQGSVIDVVVDLRVGSPTFGRWEATPLDDRGRHAVFIEEGLGHGYCALSEQAVMSYLCSSVYDPAAERAVHPLDSELGIAWPPVARKLSERDRRASGIRQLRAAGLLPVYTGAEIAHSARNPGARGLPV